MANIETIQYGKPREYKTSVLQCRLSSVDVQAKILVNGSEHAGIVTHVCRESKDHLDVCICECGHRWIKNVK